MARAGLLAVALLLFLPAVAAAQLSPGPLAAAHAKLDDDRSCGSCHASGRQVDDGKCLSCHKPLAARITAGKGLHASFAGKDCASCHVEHLGAKARLIRWPGGAPEKLDHATTGWPLRGAHATQKCAACHKERSFLAVKEACAGCHADPHKGRFGAGCASCHDEVKFANLKLDAFDHARTAFPLAGKHASVACAGCHGQPPRWTGLAFEACARCHRDPHAGRFGAQGCESCHSVQGWKQVSGFQAKHPGLSLAGGHARVACAACHDRGNERPPSKGSDCVSCHAPVHKAAFGNRCAACHASIRWLGLPRDLGLEAHRKTAFALHGEHGDVACNRCHDPSRPAAQRFRALPSATCAGCHRDPHPGGLTTRAGDCASCHDDGAFAPSKLTPELHAALGFPLDGKHEAAPCATCHAAGKGPRLDFRRPTHTCASCHANPHGTQFAAEMARDGCATCHTTAAWNIARIEHSSFPLLGGHATVACASCHAGGYKGTPRACDACHADPHLGQFRLSEPARACDACHDTVRFAGFPAARHAAMTGYALDGKHAGVACAACHPGARLHSGAEAVRWRLGYRQCRACHADPHGGSRGSITADLDCGVCHTSAGWKMSAGGGAGFDHARTGFPLLGGHRTVACSACHDGRQPLRVECAGCHTDAHAGRLGPACAECHVPAAWSETQTMERHRRTLLPLTGRHAVIECSSCHVARGARTWSDVPWDCFACHEQDYRRADLHPSHVGPPAFPRTCGSCHRTVAWSPATIDPSMLPRVATRAPASHDLRFSLRGAHRGVACESCHASAARVDCAGCHAPTLARSHRGQVVARSPGSCLACHPRGAPR